MSDKRFPIVLAAVSIPALMAGRRRRFNILAGTAGAMEISSA